MAQPGGSSAGGAQTPIAQHVDYNGFDLSDLGFLAVRRTDATITSGAATIESSFVRLSGEGGAADELATLTNDRYLSYVLIYTSDQITFKHNTGNITCGAGEDVTVAQGQIVILLQQGNGSNWHLLRTGAAGNYAASVHTHTESDITDLNHIAQTPIEQHVDYNGYDISDLGELALKRTDVSISDGAITLASSFVRINGEGGADDNLDTINSTNGGQVVIALMQDNITFRYNQGNIYPRSGQNVTVPTGQVVTLYRNGSDWYLIDPTPHTETHARGGTDEIDGDHLDIDFTPSNYSPNTTPAEAANVDDLAAHLAGIDVALAVAGGGAHATSHTDGSDDIQSATSAQKGLATAAQITKLDGIEASADVTDAANVAAAGAVMDSDISEGEGFLRKTGAGAYEAVKSNLSASADPTADEDTDDGYAVGSLWINTTNDKVWQCVDASAAAAVWRCLSHRYEALEVVLDGGGSAITTGVKAALIVPFDCEVEVAEALSIDGTSGSIQVDIWKDSYANHPPTDADSITASAPIAISSATKAQDSTLTGWTKSLTRGEILVFNVDSCTTIDLALISLRVLAR